MHKLARISYNSGDWLRPTGEARQYEAPGTYNHENGFGHEDWLFRSEWVLAGWRYAFIQGVGKAAEHFLQTPLDLTLYTIEPDKRRRYVANLYAVERLADWQAVEALAAFRQNGWLDTMRAEVERVDGDANALGHPKWADHILNVRFRAENVDLFPMGAFAERDDQWLANRHRYLLYDFPAKDVQRVERRLVRRGGNRRTSGTRPIFRRASRAIIYTPEHRKMQALLYEELQREFGPRCVSLETDFVDITVRSADEITLYEIKTDLEPRAVIRDALGQLLEYAFHPRRAHDLPVRLVIVGRNPLGPTDKVYMDILQSHFTIPLAYKIVSI